MTKTLTEQYENKELSGWYYAKTKDGSINHWLLFTDTIEFEKDIEEVLAPVPSYDEYKRLQEQLNDANEILMMPDNIKYHDEVVEMLNNYIKKWGVK